MAIVNRTPDSFYDRGATFAFDRALQRVRDVVAEGADIVDIGGVKAAPGEEVTVAEELERTASFVAAVRAEFPDLLISVDTWRHEVGQAACQAGADVLNDAWGGWDPDLAAVAGQHGVALVCTHAGGVEPRTRPHRVSYDDVVADVLRRTVAEAERAVALGVDPQSILIDPGHDFGKNTYHSLEATARRSRRIRLAGTGLAVQQGLRRRDARSPGGRATDWYARDHIGKCVARGSRVSRAQRHRDAADAGHGRHDHGHPSPGSNRPRPRLTLEPENP
jgi:dihydropteroate synthase